jgi:nucleotide-binding universal stress UspA family protein
MLPADEPNRVYNDVLVPTDGSEPAEAAVPNAVDLADRYGARLHALYVADTTEYSTITFEGKVVDTLEREGREVVDDVVAAAEERNLEAIGVVKRGGVYETILDYVAEEDVDIVVMGTHGRSGLGRAVLGSVTERVVRNADVPVLTVQSHEEEG